jgi:hypothetical protein
MDNKRTTGLAFVPMLHELTQLLQIAKANDFISAQEGKNILNDMLKATGVKQPKPIETKPTEAKQ